MAGKRAADRYPISPERAQEIRRQAREGFEKKPYGPACTCGLHDQSKASSAGRFGPENAARCLVHLGPCEGCGEGDEGNHAGGWCQYT